MKTRMMLAAALLLSGCATQKVLTPTGGSKADGTIKMSYQYGALERPEVNLQQGADAAAQRCRAWGYANAEPFGSVQRHCEQPSGYGCNLWTATIEYQCTGAAAAAN